MRSLHIGVDAWIIQDGNYGDFEVGGSHRFAVEFSPHEVVAIDAPTSAGCVLRHVGGALHEIEGAVVRAAPNDWVIDFGMRAFQEARPPEWARPGVLLRGVVYLGIDPFFYFERLKNEPGMPDLFLEWTIRRICLETTPWVESRDASGRILRARADRDPTFVEVPKTDAWNDDGGHAHYVLECDATEPAN